MFDKMGRGRQSSDADGLAKSEEFLLIVIALVLACKLSS